MKAVRSALDAGGAGDRIKVAIATALTTLEVHVQVVLRAMPTVVIRSAISIPVVAGGRCSVYPLGTVNVWAAVVTAADKISELGLDKEPVEPVVRVRAVPVLVLDLSNGLVAAIPAYSYICIFTLPVAVPVIVSLVVKAVVK